MRGQVEEGGCVKFDGIFYDECFVLSLFLRDSGSFSAPYEGVI